MIFIGGVKEAEMLTTLSSCHVDAGDKRTVNMLTHAEEWGEVTAAHILAGVHAVRFHPAIARAHLHRRSRAHISAGDRAHLSRLSHAHISEGDCWREAASRARGLTMIFIAGAEEVEMATFAFLPR